MNELIQFNWQAFDPWTGIKITLGLVIVTVLLQLTGHSWMVTGIVVMLAWLTNTPGPLSSRIGGMLAFAVCGTAVVVISSLLGTSLWSNVVMIAVIGFLGTIALYWGTRAFMVGFSLICLAIYAPLLVADTGAVNCILAICTGTGVMILLAAADERWAAAKGEKEAAKTEDSGQAGFQESDLFYLLTYALTVAAVLAVTTLAGWSELQTDPTLMVGAAFFVIGFDPKKTWVAGISRLIGLLAGTLLGFVLGQALGAGTTLEIAMLLAVGLSFAASGVHPGAWMFFFMAFVAMGWPGMEEAALILTLGEKFYGEAIGVGVALTAIALLQWIYLRRYPQQVT